MNRAKDGLEEQLLSGDALKAANDPEIADSGRQPGWDPYEIWRTRVRSTREQNPTDGEDSTS